MASAIISRVAGHWKARRIMARIQAQVHAQRFVDDAQTRVSESRQRASGGTSPRAQVDSVGEWKYNDKHGRLHMV